MKSILRMDQDQNIRRIALRDLNIQEGYYEYETNIFFDDAFQLRYCISFRLCCMQCEAINMHPFHYLSISFDIFSV